MVALALGRGSERRTERLLDDLLSAQGWDVRKPPRGSLYVQTEYRENPALADALATASKTGVGFGIPEGILVDGETTLPLAVIETKAAVDALADASTEAEGYGAALVTAGYTPVAIGLAGTDDAAFSLHISKWSGHAWVPVTYDGHPISWIPNRADLLRVTVPNGPAEIRPSPPPLEVLAKKADEMNRLLREADIKDEYRPTHVAAMMLALWYTRGNIRRDPSFILRDINSGCRDAFIRAGKSALASSLRVDRANRKLATRAPRIAKILERLNITVLTAEHDYLGQLYETFFRYTGGNTIGQYFTPRHIARMMVDICGATSGDILLDIACGTGGFFVAYMDRLVKEQHLSRADMVQIIQHHIIGFESEPNTAALCVANMILRGDGATQIRQSDSLTVGDFPGGAATVAVMNPPFPHKQNGHARGSLCGARTGRIAGGGQTCGDRPGQSVIQGGRQGKVAGAYPHAAFPVGGLPVARRIVSTLCIGDDLCGTPGKRPPAPACAQDRLCPAAS